MHLSNKMTGAELVAFCRSKIGTEYVYGMKGAVLTAPKYNQLQRTYGEDAVWPSDVKKIGKVCVDCSGLISWACGISMGSSQWMHKADAKKPISTIKYAPVGALVWMQGHIGVYSGMKNGEPYYVAADGSAYGVREVPISCNKFTHWLLVRSVFDYEEVNEVVTKETIIVDGKEHTVDMIRKDDVTFIKTRDIAELVGYDADNRGKVPVLNKK